MMNGGIGGIIDSEFLRNYYQGDWESAVLKWFSSTDTAPTQRYSNVVPDKHDGYFLENTEIPAYIEIEKLGGEVQLSTGTEDIWNLPYPARLRPLSDYSFLASAKNVIFVSLQFFAYDVTTIGSTHQTAGVNSEITDSLTSANNAYVQTRFLYNMPVRWINNYFRPKFKINGQNILSFYERTGIKTSGGHGYSQHRGDMSIGEQIPLDLNLYKLVPGSVQSIEVEGFVAQRIKDGTDIFLKRYPIECRAFITYQK